MSHTQFPKMFATQLDIFPYFPHSKVRLRVPIGTSLSNLNLFVSEVQGRDLDQATEKHLVR